MKMSDLISRQAAIDALGEEPMVWSGKDEYEQGLNNQWHYDMTAIKAVPSVEAGWIPVTERLPNGQEEVIVSCCDTSGDGSYNYTSCGWTTRDGEYWIVDNEINYFVIAWMPLPEPYKGE